MEKPVRKRIYGEIWEEKCVYHSDGLSQRMIMTAESRITGTRIAITAVSEETLI